AVLQGQIRYFDHEVRTTQGLFLLRRNVHRLEKGMVMRPRRQVFGAEYILETVRAFEAAAERAGNINNDGESHIEWARDVLTEYFRTVGPHPIVDRARARFEAVHMEPCGERIPYRRDISRPVPVEYDRFAELASRRRSV